jgi:hypothetical protein
MAQKSCYDHLLEYRDADPKIWEQILDEAYLTYGNPVVNETLKCLERSEQARELLQRMQDNPVFQALARFRDEVDADVWERAVDEARLLYGDSVVSEAWRLMDLEDDQNYPPQSTLENIDEL